MADLQGFQPRDDLAVLRAILDALPAHIAVVDAAGVIVAVNAAWRRFAESHGLTTHDHGLGTSYLAVCDAAARDGDDDARRTAEGIRGVLSGERDEVYLEYPWHGPESEAWFALRVTFFDHGGKRWGVIAHHDITERWLADLALRESEERYRSVVTSMSEGIVVQSGSGEITTCNRAAEEILGLTREQMTGRTSLDPRWQAIHEDGTPFPGETHPAMVTLRTGEPQRSVIMGVHKPDGELTWISINSQPMFGPGDAKPRAVVASFTDVTELKKSEEHHRQVQKMEAVGRLAGGIAHDFNNLLTAIMGHGELALEELGAEQHPAGLNVRLILETATRAAHLTSKLLTFGRRRVEATASIPLNLMILELHDMIRRLVPENIEIVTELSPALGWIRADPTEIEQVLINLVVNATDAMPEGGRLTIRTANAHLEETGGDGARPGDYVLLQVEDTGKGIPEAIHDRIFEPFFTTKEEGRGTGLGLATIYTVVRNAAGDVRFASSPDRGTTFDVYFPRHAATSAEEARLGVREELRTSLEGDERVLLVEDDAVLREVLAVALAAKGYDVVEASCGEEALRQIEEMDEAPELLITDGIMPGISGRELADRLTAVRPGLKILIISGHVGDTLRSLSELPPGVVLFEKPFTPSALLDRIRELLDGT